MSLRLPCRILPPRHLCSVLQEPRVLPQALDLLCLVKRLLLPVLLVVRHSAGRVCSASQWLLFHRRLLSTRRYLDNRLLANRLFKLFPPFRRLLPPSERLPFLDNRPEQQDCWLAAFLDRVLRRLPLRLPILQRNRSLEPPYSDKRRVIMLAKPLLVLLLLLRLLDSDRDCLAIWVWAEHPILQMPIATLSVVERFSAAPLRQVKKKIIARFFL